MYTQSYMMQLPDTPGTLDRHVKYSDSDRPHAAHLLPLDLIIIFQLFLFFLTRLSLFLWLRSSPCLRSTFRSSSHCLTRRDRSGSGLEEWLQTGKLGFCRSRTSRPFRCGSGKRSDRCARFGSDLRTGGERVGSVFLVSAYGSRSGVDLRFDRFFVRVGCLRVSCRRVRPKIRAGVLTSFFCFLGTAGV